jgi:hypothetical protein
MDRALKLARDLLVIVVLAGLALVLYDAHRALGDTGGQVRYTLDNANRLIRELAQTSANLRHATAAWETSSQQQAAYFTSAAQKTGVDLDALHDVILQTGSTLTAANSAIAQLQTAVANQDRALQQLEQHGTAQFDALQPLLANITLASSRAAALAGDPSIADTLHQVDLTTTSLASAVASVDRQVRMIEPVTKKATTPPSKAAFIFNTALDLAAKLGSALAGFAK